MYVHKLGDDLGTQHSKCCIVTRELNQTYTLMAVDQLSPLTLSRNCGTGRQVVYALRRPLLELANEFPEEATKYFLELLQEILRRCCAPLLLWSRPVVARHWWRVFCCAIGPDAKTAVKTFPCSLLADFNHTGESA